MKLYFVSVISILECKLPLRVMLSYVITFWTKKRIFCILFNALIRKKCAALWSLFTDLSQKGRLDGFIAHTFIRLVIIQLKDLNKCNMKLQASYLNITIT